MPPLKNNRRAKQEKRKRTRLGINQLTMLINWKINSPMISKSKINRYHVGKYPSITGPNPLYSPLIPSSIQIRFKLAAMPLYKAPLGTPNPARSTCKEFICACNLVLTTSRGHVIKLVRIPAQAPATAFLELGVREP
jgi:hypothetical protein